MPYNSASWIERSQVGVEVVVAKENGREQATTKDEGPGAASEKIGVMVKGVGSTRGRTGGRVRRNAVKRNDSVRNGRRR